MVEIKNESEFIDLVEKNKGVIIDFYSLSCGPCRNIAPFYESLAREYRVSCPSLKFGKINCANKTYA